MNNRTRLHRRPIIGPRRHLEGRTQAPMPLAPGRRDPDTVAGIPGVYEADARFILRAMGRTKREPPDPPAPAGRETLAALRAEARRLRVDVEELERKRHDKR